MSTHLRVTRIRTIFARLLVTAATILGWPPSTAHADCATACPADGEWRPAPDSGNAWCQLETLLETPGTHCLSGDWTSTSDDSCSTAYLEGDVELCGPPAADRDAIETTLKLVQYPVLSGHRLTIENMTLVETNPIFPAGLNLIEYLDQSFGEVSIRNVVWDSTGPLIKAPAILATRSLDVTLEQVYVDNESAALVEACEGVVNATLTMDGSQVADRTSPSPTPLFSVGGTCTDPAATLSLTGQLTNAGTVMLTPHSGLTYDHVKAQGLTVDGIDCSPCIHAEETLETINSSFTSSEQAGADTWFTSGDSVFLTDTSIRDLGGARTIAHANGRIQALRLAACSATPSNAPPFDLLRNEALEREAGLWLYNSVLRRSTSSTPLISGDPEVVALRGVTLVSGTSESVLPDSAALRAVNTFFALTDSTDGQLPQLSEYLGTDLTSASVVLHTAEGVFEGEAATDCDALPIVTEASLIDAGERDLQGESDSVFAAMAENEIGDNISAANQTLVDADTETYVVWCDPDDSDGGSASWPDIGAYGGPLSDPSLRPQNDSPRACTDTDGGTDSGDSEGSDTATSATGRPSVERWSYASGCASSTAAAVLPLGLIALLLRRREDGE